jgi:hypothetical protein
MNHALGNRYWTVTPCVPFTSFRILACHWCSDEKLLLTGIAALFLATGTAHAQTTEDYNEFGEEKGDRIFECGDVLVNHTHVSDAEIYTIQISAWHKSRDRKGPLPIVTFNSRDQTLTVNGERCQTMTRAQSCMRRCGQDGEVFESDKEEACYNRCIEGN